MLFAAPALAAPFIPTQDTEIVERLPASREPAVSELRQLHRALARQPDLLPLAVQVARRDLDYGGPRFDRRYNGYAQAALAPWWNLPDPPAPVRLLRAIVRQREHDFEAALADLDTLIAAEPANLQALLTRAVVRQVRADYTRADADCDTIAALKATLAATICSAAVAGAGRDALASYHAFADAIARLGPGAPEALRTWALSVLAELAARLDDAAVADRRFRDALALAPRDGYLLGAYADFLLDHDRPREVVDLLAEQTDVDPLLLRLAIAEHRIDPGSLAAAAHIAALADRFAAATARGESVHRREEARFTLTLRSAPRQALALAIANWQVQREPADARVLLESALAARDRAAAGPALRWLEANGFADDRLAALARAVQSLPPA